MDRMNTLLFPLINASAHPPAFLVTAARLSADWLLYVVVLLAGLAWVAGRADLRRGLLDAAATVAIALAINFTIAAAWYHPRPFELGIGHQLLPHGLETSFPSDHATLLFAFAFGAVRAGLGPLPSALAFTAALAVAWARVYLGVHWPLDMIGSLIVALVAVAVFGSCAASNAVARARDKALRLYDRLLDALHVPLWLSPRTGAKPG